MTRFTKHGKLIQTRADRRKHAARTSWPKRSRGLYDEAPSPPNICYAKDCGEPISPTLLMCWPHWKRVPRKVQTVIWQTNPTHPLFQPSRLAARASIAAKEGRPLTPEETQALADYGLGSDGHPVKEVQA